MIRNQLLGKSVAWKAAMRANRTGVICSQLVCQDFEAIMRICQQTVPQHFADVSLQLDEETISLYWNDLARTGTRLLTPSLRTRCVGCFLRDHKRRGFTPTPGAGVSWNWNDALSSFHTAFLEMVRRLSHPECLVLMIICLNRTVRTESCFLSKWRIPICLPVSSCSLSISHFRGSENNQTNEACSPHNQNTHGTGKSECLSLLPADVFKCHTWAEFPGVWLNSLEEATEENGQKNITVWLPKLRARATSPQEKREPETTHDKSFPPAAIWHGNTVTMRTSHTSRENTGPAFRDRTRTGLWFTPPCCAALCGL